MINQPQVNKNYFIITGAMGSGKSTILKELQNIGYRTINEPAREIITEQRAINGDGIYDRDPKLFYQLMLSRALYEYKQNQVTTHIVIGDRGIPDNIIYAKLFGINCQAAENAAQLYRYNSKVFYLPAYEHIYVTDQDRKMSFSDAKKFGEMLKQVYTNLNYQVIDVPFDLPEMRAKFIIKHIT